MNNKNWIKESKKCSNVPSQTYECCYHIYLPWKCKSPWEEDNKKRNKLVAIDKCLLPEIIKLWELGIKTTGCCCGHGRTNPLINVDFDDIQRMKDMGYKVQYNPCRPNDEDTFYPKTILNYQNSKCTEI